MKAVIFPYNLGSASARNLANETGFLRIKADGAFKHTRNHLVINYGSSAQGRTITGMPILNRPEKVANAIDKLITLRTLHAGGVPVCNFTTDRATALGWLNAGKVVFARKQLRSSGGAGIVVMKRNDKHAPPTQLDEVEEAPLYTELFSKDQEYRVHIFKGGMIDAAQKRKANDFPDERTPYIRNMANGWIFARDNVVVPDAARVAAINAVNALELDFGAVDLAVNKKGEVAVFEVNTAPGLEGTTVKSYANAFVQYLQKQQTGLTLAKTFTRRAAR